MKEATNREKRRLMVWFGRTAKVLLGLGVILLGFTLYYFGRRAVSQTSLFELETIEYQGARRFDAEAFNVLLLRTFGHNLLTVDLDRVRALVESEGWVKHAVVRRRLPDRLCLYLTEREPEAVAAIENDLYVVDDEGVILDSFGPAYDFLDRPIVKGLRNTARENAAEENARRMKVYTALLQDFQAKGQDYAAQVSEVDVSDPGRVAVIPVSEPITIYLGGDSFADRFERFLGQRDLYERLKQKYGLIEYVDVTLDNKIIFHTPKQVTSG
ncbi:MAG: FtsQ-type POTRA domain-containing protein [Acidobacteriota bacterium]